MKKANQKQSKQRLRHLLNDRSRRIRLLLAKGLIKDEKDIPEDAIPIDPSCCTLANFWSPTVFYRDIEFLCSECKRPDVWTAESQQYYFEVMHSSPYKSAKRCFDCRQKELARKIQARADSGHAIE